MNNNKIPLHTAEHVDLLKARVAQQPRSPGSRGFTRTAQIVKNAEWVIPAADPKCPTLS